MKVLLYLKKSGMDKSGQAPIMGRITYNRTMAQFSSKLSCNPKLWNVRESRLNGKSREAVATNSKLEQLLLSVQRAYQTLCERGIEFSAKDIKEQFHPKSVIRISQCCMAVRNPSTFPILKETTFSFSTTWPGIGCACLSFSPDMREWKSVRTGLS